MPSRADHVVVRAGDGSAGDRGSAISSAVTIHGPIGQNVSMLLENENTPDCISRVWMSRAVMSLFLASDDAAHITGGYKVADGGYNMVGA